MRIFLDTNVVCDAMLQRDPWKDAAHAIFAASKGGHVVAIVSSLTVANLYYISSKLLGKPQALATVRECLANLRLPQSIAMLSKVR